MSVLICVVKCYMVINAYYCYYYTKIKQCSGFNWDF